MIKEFDLSELNDVMDIWFETNKTAHPFISEQFWIDNFDFVKSVLPKSEIFVYVDDTQIKGFIGISNESYIEGLFVLNKHQSQGIGRKLLNECKKRYSYLELKVYLKNNKAIKFYKDNKFKIIKKVENSDTKELEYIMTWKK